MKGILFNTEMVRSILDGKKTQTRRLSGLEDVNKTPDIWEFMGVKTLDYKTKKYYKGRLGAYFHTEKLEDRTTHVCPQVARYQVGDTLYVRETWQYYSTEDDLGYCYKADALIKNITYTDLDDEPIKWRPSIFMPKDAARIFLKVTDVRVERLQDMKYSEFINEGIPYRQFETDIQNDFITLWNSIYQEKGYGWDINPWVFVYEFEKVEKPC